MSYIFRRVEHKLFDFDSANRHVYYPLGNAKEGMCWEARLCHIIDFPVWPWAFWFCSVMSEILTKLIMWGGACYTSSRKVHFIRAAESLEVGHQLPKQDTCTVEKIQQLLSGCYVRGWGVEAGEVLTFGKVHWLSEVHWGAFYVSCIEVHAKWVAERCMLCE